jgi:hypothetical protein
VNVGGIDGATPFVRTVIVNSRTTIDAPASQSTGGSTYSFVSWSDGGARSHEVTATTAPMSLVATYQLTGSGGGTTLFSDGFESGGLTAWTLNSGVVATTAEHYAGSYGGRATATNSRAYAYRTLAASQTDLTVSVRFKVLSQSGTIYLVRTASPTGKYGGGVYRTSSGALAFRNTVTATTLTSATTISAGVWHELRLRQVIGTSGTVEIWLDGLRVNDIAASQNLGSESIARFQIGDNNNGRTFDYAFDEALATAP